MSTYRNDPTAGQYTEMSPEEAAYTEQAARTEAGKIVSRNRNRPAYLALLAAHLGRMASELTTPQAPTVQQDPPALKPEGREGLFNE